MLKVSFNTLWKVAVTLLLAVIAFYSYKIHYDLVNGDYYQPTPVSCGIYNGAAPANGSSTSALCLRPMTSTSSAAK